MASVDDIFKNSGFSGKRKLDATRDPDEVYKSTKLSPGDSQRHNGAEEENDPAENDDGDYGPALPAEEDEGDDEEGRFFGGGITKHESEILDYVDDADKDVAYNATIDAAWLRKTALNFEKRITKNAELRAKFEDNPQKFIGSEADLDDDIKGLSVLSEHPELYSEFAKLGCVASLVGLLTHENTDIAIDAVEIIGELTDEDVDAEEKQWNALARALIEADLLALLVSNLSRLNEDDESDRNGVYHILGVVENLCSQARTAQRAGEERDLLAWLLKRIQSKEASVSQNKQYAAEILAILAQASQDTRLRLVKLDAADALLQLVAPYRRRDPDRSGEEEEYMENLFETLTCIVESAEGRTKFSEAEGLELCLIMIKEGKASKTPALRLLDHAIGGNTGSPETVALCQKLVEVGGLKGLFTLFMKKSPPPQRQQQQQQHSHDPRVVGHLLSMFASLLRMLPADSAERIRTLAKFVEKDYEKTARLVALHREFSARVEKAAAAAAAELQQPETDAPAEEKEQFEVEVLSRRLDAGLYNLQLDSVILAWLAAEDRGARVAISRLLAQRDESLGDVKRILEEQLAGLDTSDDEAQGGTQDTRDMLGTLIGFL